MKDPTPQEEDGDTGLLPAGESDGLTHLVATLCGTPIAFLGFADDRTLRFLSRLGIASDHVPKDLVLGAPEDWGEGTVVIPDAAADPRCASLRAHPAFRDVRFLAAAAVEDRDGSVSGLLAVLDRIPRDLSAAQRDGLACVARQISLRLSWARLSPSSASPPSPTAPIEGEEVKLLRTLVDQMPDTIYVKDVQGRYIFDNHAHRRFLHARHPGDVVGKTVHDLFPSELAARYEADDRSVIESGTPLVNREEPITGPDGTTRWVSTTKVPQYDDRGRVRGLVAIGRDITLRKRAQDRVQAVAKQLRRDLALAGETQAAFLPTTYPDVRGRGGSLRFAHHHRPSSGVGGDFFTIIPFGPTRAALFICDVMGHGIPSALVAAGLHALVYELARDDPDPGTLLTTLNERLDRLIDQSNDTLFATACYLRLDMDAMQAACAIAGHPPPLQVRRKNPGDTQLLASPGPHADPALGLASHHPYRTHQAEVSVGECLLLFTDGLFETMNPEGELFGLNPLIECATRHQDQPGPALALAILDEVTRFANDRPPNDDICLIAVDINPPSP